MLGSLTATDPIDHSQGASPYQYAANDPIALVDPTGMSPWYAGVWEDAANAASWGGTTIEAAGGAQATRFLGKAWESAKYVNYGKVAIKAGGYLETAGKWGLAGETAGLSVIVINMAQGCAHASSVGGCVDNAGYVAGMTVIGIGGGAAAGGPVCAFFLETGPGAAVCEGVAADAGGVAGSETALHTLPSG